MLELKEDTKHHKRAQRVKNVGLVIFVSFLALAFSGLLGGEGPLNRKVSISNGSTITVEYEPYARKESPTLLELNFKSLNKDSTQLWLENSFFKEVEIIQMYPEPNEMFSNDRKTYMKYHGTENLKLLLSVKYEVPGSRNYNIGIDGSNETISITPFVYP